MLKNVLKSEKGVIDLPSIITGVILTGILASVVTVTFVAVIPWFQNNAAKDSLAAVQVAQTSARQDFGMYDTYPNLVSSNYMVNRDDEICIQLRASNSEYSAFARSASGAVFVLTSETDAVAQHAGSVPCTF